MIVKIYCIILTVTFSINAQNSEDSSEFQPCYTDKGKDGNCVPYYICKDGKLNTDGSDILDTRFSSECREYYELCCESENQHTKEESLIVKRDASNATECGIRNKVGVLSEILDERQGESQYGEFPWMVALLQKDLINESFAESYKCGGSLISKNVVLTAAHCVNNLTSNNIIARTGEWDTQGDYELFPHVDHEVEKVIIHKKFIRANLHNDIALLFLKTDVQLTQTVNTICLPSQDQLLDTTRCFVTGWGKTKFGYDENHSNSPVILKKVELPTVQHADCQDKMRKTRLSRVFILDGSFMCAGGEEEIDSCKGDGGSPLVCPIAGVPNKYYQAGIVSWGIGCGEKDVPGVYVNVAKFSDWIYEQMTFVDFDIK